jgi:nitronate monooxygenase
MKKDNWPGHVRMLCEILGIARPIVQAPMAGGPSTPELVAAVSNAGGLGSMGAGYLAPENIDRDIKKVRALTDRPFSVNLFIPAEAVTDAPTEELLSRLKSFSDELDVNMPALTDETIGFSFDDQFQVILENNVPVFSFTFGVPESRHMEELHKRNVAVIGTATCVEEGVLLEEAGCTAVAAQGSEAGGHRGSFCTSKGVPMIGSMSLIPQLVDRLSIPVLASGGIMDGRGVAAALALGASGVQLGTAFLGCQEAGISGAWLEALLKSGDTSTVLTKAFTGKYARGIKNKFIEEMTRLEDQVPEYPAQHNLTQSLRAEAKARGNPEFMSLWAGQSSALIKRTSAKELVEDLVRESREVILRLNEEI